MESDNYQELTSWLQRYGEGTAGARNRLYELVLTELRVIARSRLNRFPGENELGTTALVHEMWLKLSKRMETGNWESRKHFYGVAAHAMWSILVDRRRRQRNRNTPPLEQAPEPAFREPKLDILLAAEFLERLHKFDPDGEELYKLKKILGLTNREIAEMWNCTERTIERHMAKVNEWINREYYDRNDA